MCTAVSWNGNCHYFGRNLDLEYAYQETVTITPRNYPFQFRHLPTAQHHYAMIGIATALEGYPLYYEATNEMGLSMAGLNFPRLAHYADPVAGNDNVASFELIPWILGQCKTVAEAKLLLERINITADAFREDLSPTPLHWLLADKHQSITLEAMSDGLHIHNNPVGVLTNNPPFDYHLFNLSNYRKISPFHGENAFSQEITLEPYSNGMGSIGLPGDYSSASRFVRAAFVKLNSLPGSSDDQDVCQFFHILNAVSMPQGAVAMPNNTWEITRYSSCCNTDQGIYYYTTYENSRITAVELYKEDLSTDQIITYPLQVSADFYKQN